MLLSYADLSDLSKRWYEESFYSYVYPYDDRKSSSVTPAGRPWLSKRANDKIPYSDQPQTTIWLEEAAYRDAARFKYDRVTELEEQIEYLREELKRLNRYWG